MSCTAGRAYCPSPCQTWHLKACQIAVCCCGGRHSEDQQCATGGRQVELSKEMNHLLETGEGDLPGCSWLGNKLRMESRKIFKQHGRTVMPSPCWWARGRGYVSVV